jgi:hypothetical protein
MAEQTIRAAAEMAAPAEGERRRAHRHPIVLAIDCVVDAEEHRWALVRDVSAWGVGLIVGCHLEPGSEVRLKLATGPGRVARWLRARVIHSSPRPQGNFLLSCELADRLSQEELEYLLRSEWER